MGQTSEQDSVDPNPYVAPDAVSDQAARKPANWWLPWAISVGSGLGNLGILLGVARINPWVIFDRAVLLLFVAVVPISVAVTAITLKVKRRVSVPGMLLILLAAIWIAGFNIAAISAAAAGV